MQTKQTDKTLRPRKLPTQSRSKTTVQRILDGAAKLLEEGGAESFNTHNLAEISGVSSGSIYQYFGNKKQILFALYGQRMRETVTVYKDMFSGKNKNLPFEEFWATLNLRVSKVGWTNHGNIELKRALAYYPELRHAISPVLEDFYSVVAEVLRFYGSSWTAAELHVVAELLFELAYMRIELASNKSATDAKTLERIMRRIELDLLRRAVKEPSPDRVFSASV